MSMESVFEQWMIEADITSMQEAMTAGILPRCRSCKCTLLVLRSMIPFCMRLWK